MGDLAKVVDWKLNAGFPPSIDMLPGDFRPYSEFVSEGERGWRGWAE